MRQEVIKLTCDNCGDETTGDTSTWWKVSYPVMTATVCPGAFSYYTAEQDYCDKCVSRMKTALMAEKAGL
jgi:hypothetical protein